VKKGRTISAAGWQDMQAAIPDNIASSSGQRAALEQAGVPAGHPVYHYIDELMAAMTAMGDVAKAQDAAGLVPAFERLRTANQMFIDSCGAITRH